MYQPFEINHYLGQIILAAVFGKALFLTLLIPIYAKYLASTEPQSDRG